MDCSRFAFRLSRTAGAIVCALAVGFASAARADDGGQWRGVPVFMLHHVNPLAPPAAAAELTITPVQFAAELQSLAAAHYTTITAAELAAALGSGRHPQRTVVLTFDDGYADQYEYVLPLLRKYGFRATFYIIRDTVGTPGHLTWSQIRALRDEGMEIGDHGTEHVALSELDRAGQFAQAATCADALRRLAGVNPVTYAYPSGDYNAITLDVMKTANMHAAFTTASGLVTSLARPYELPRIRVNRDGAENAFAKWL